MEYKNVHIIYFSPTQTSAKTAYAIAEGLSGDVLLESDITYDAPAAMGISLRLKECSPTKAPAETGTKPASTNVSDNSFNASS